MNNKTFIIIGLIICLLFTAPMVSAAEVSADSDLIDNLDKYSKIFNK